MQAMKPRTLAYQKDSYRFLKPLLSNFLPFLPHAQSAFLREGDCAYNSFPNCGNLNLEIQLLLVADCACSCGITYMSIFADSGIKKEKEDDAGYHLAHLHGTFVKQCASQMGKLAFDTFDISGASKVD